MSHKIKESMNVWSTKKKLDGGSAFLSLTFGTRSKKMCEPYVEVAIRIDSQLTPNLSLLPNLDWRQTNFGSNFSVWEKKNWDGLCHVYWFLSNISSFPSRWVVYGFTGGELTCFVVLGMDLQENTEGLSLGGQNIIQPKKKLYNQRVLESLDLTERHSGWKSFWEIVQIVRKRLQRKSDWLGKIPNYFWLLCCQKKSIGTYFLVSTVSFFPDKLLKIETKLPFFSPTVKKSKNYERWHLSQGKTFIRTRSNVLWPPLVDPSSILFSSSRHFLGK